MHFCTLGRVPTHAQKKKVALAVEFSIVLTIIAIGTACLMN